MATFRKRGDAWRAEVVRAGLRKSATFDTKLQAEAWAAKIESEILSGAVTVTQSRMTVVQMLERYRDEVSPLKRGHRWERLRIDAFIRMVDWIGKRVDQIDANQIAAFRDMRLREVGSSTVNRELNLLSGIWECARREWRVTLANPVRDVRRPKDPPHREQRISNEQRDALVAGLAYQPGTIPTESRHRVALAFIFAIETGMRCGEICAMQCADVHLSKRYVRLPMTKNGSERAIWCEKSTIRKKLF